MFYAKVVTRHVAFMLEDIYTLGPPRSLWRFGDEAM